MLEIRDTKQGSFFGNYIYDKMVSKEHILRKINETIDFSFINRECSDAYCLTNGRPGWSPVLMFKIVFLQFLYDLSDYVIEEELNDRLSFKMFVGLEVEEAPPDHSSISRFRDRLGVERFKTIFNRIVESARAKGIVSDKLHILDATDIKAKVDLYRIKKEHNDQEPNTYIDNHSPDKDAKVGRKDHGNKQFYGYQAHCLMDAESEVILNIDTTPGDAREHAQLKPLCNELPASPKVLTADKAYDCQDNHRYLKEHHIRNGIILKKNHTKEYLHCHVKRISNIAKRYRCIIEHKIAELKRYHSMHKARYWGLVKNRIQTYITAICVNVKRVVNLLYSCASPPKICLRCVKT
jgi:IS5 family transposase